MNPCETDEKHHKFFRPLVRPSILDDEWIQGYWARVVVLNGSRPVQRDQIQLSEGMFGGVLSTSQAVLHRAGDDANSSRRYLGPFKVPDWLMRKVQTSVPICHRCFRESPHIRIGWRLRYAYVCEKHGTLLNNTCPQCKRRWFAHDCAIGMCGCGFDLRCSDHERSSEPLLRHQLGLTADLSISALAPPVEGDIPFTMNDPIADRLSILLFQHTVLGTLSQESRRIRSELGGRKPIDMSEMSVNPGNGPWPIEALIKAFQDANNHLSLRSLFSRLKWTETFAPTLISRLPLVDWSHQCDLAFSNSVASISGVAIGPASADAQSNGCTASSLCLKQAEFMALKRVEVLFPLSTVRSDSAGFNSIELLDSLDQIAMCHVTWSDQMVRLSSRELWNVRFASTIPTYFQRILQGWCWVYSDNRFSGFSRFFIERDAFNRMRKELGTAFRRTHTAIEQRNFFGPSDLLWTDRFQPWGDDVRACTKLFRKRARTKRAHPDQLSIWP